MKAALSTFVTSTPIEELRETMTTPAPFEEAPTELIPGMQLWIDIDGTENERNLWNGSLTIVQSLPEGRVWLKMGELPVV